jgi:phosphohistidine phosphatase SixA
LFFNDSINVLKIKHTFTLTIKVYFNLKLHTQPMYSKFLFVGAVLFALSCDTPTTMSHLKKINEGQVILASNEIKNIRGIGNPQVTICILVRHAEKDTAVNPKNPPLTVIGKQRATALAEILKNYPIAKVYYTGGMSRTFETAQPLLQEIKCPSDTFYAKGVEPFFYNALDAHRGQSILIVGNSNTIPQMLNCFELKEKYKNIDDKEYDNIFIVSAKDKSDVCIQHFKY